MKLKKAIGPLGLIFDLFKVLIIIYYTLQLPSKTLTGDDPKKLVASTPVQYGRLGLKYRPGGRQKYFHGDAYKIETLKRVVII